MIDDKKIEDAARRNSDKYRNYPTLSDEDRDKVSIGSFRDCAKWMQKEFLKNLWHPAGKDPEENRNILVEHKCGDLHYHTENYDCYYEDPWDVRVRILNITRWLYIDDLFPKEGDNHD